MRELRLRLVLDHNRILLIAPPIQGISGRVLLDHRALQAALRRVPVSNQLPSRTLLQWSLNNECYVFILFLAAI